MLQYPEETLVLLACTEVLITFIADKCKTKKWKNFVSFHSLQCQSANLKTRGPLATMLINWPQGLNRQDLCRETLHTATY